MNSLAKRSQKRMMTKVQWAMLKIRDDNWVAYFKIWSRRSLQRSLRKELKHTESQSDVDRFTEAVLRDANNSRPEILRWD